MEEVADKYNLLLKKFKTRENGPVADSMNRMGLEYKINFGVALQELKEFAKTHENDHDFALVLWEKKSREAKLFSTMIAVPEELTEIQIQNYLSGISNVELAEQASINLLSKISNGFEKALDWMKDSNPFVQLTGLLTIARIAQVNKDLESKRFEMCFEAFSNVGTKEYFSLKRGLSRALFQIAKRNEHLKSKTLGFINSIKEYDTELNEWLDEEVVYYL